MLSNESGNFVFQCNDCGEVLQTETSNFDAARNLLHQHRWRVITSEETPEEDLSKQNHEESRHFCPHCETGKALAKAEEYKKQRTEAWKRRRCRTCGKVGVEYMPTGPNDNVNWEYGGWCSLACFHADPNDEQLIDPNLEKRA
jgi:hypothetical protein